jgi:hypothetical protein
MIRRADTKLKRSGTSLQAAVSFAAHESGKLAATRSMAHE